MTVSSRIAIEKLLRELGLSSMDDPGKLGTQLGSDVRNHEHLQYLLSMCPPDQRSDVYEVLMPSLRFRPHPLEDYGAAKAVGEQFPLFARHWQNPPRRLTLG